MSKLPSVINKRSLAEKIDEALDIETEIDDPNGGKMNMPDSLKESIQMQNVADTIADHVSQVSINIPEIESSTLSYGSGDTGRQTQLYLQPSGSVTKDELRSIASDLNMILEEVFPAPYLVGITHENSIDDEGYPVETDEFSLFLVYRVRTSSKPSPPSGDSTEVIS